MNKKNLQDKTRRTNKKHRLMHITIETTQLDIGRYRLRSITATYTVIEQILVQNPPFSGNRDVFLHSVNDINEQTNMPTSKPEKKNQD